MRKLLLPVTILLALATCYFGYRYFSLLNSLAITVDKTKCAACMEYNNITPTDSKLDMNLVKTMAFNYQNPLPTGETHSVWFSLDRLKKFIYQIESKTCSCTGNLGIRIYYGRYPSVSKWNVFSSSLTGLTTSYAGIHSVFLIPTIDKLNSATNNYDHWDFDPADPRGCAPGYAESYSTMAADTLPAPTYTLAPYGTSITALMAMNHGDACPPVPQGMTKCPDVGAYFNK